MEALFEGSEIEAERIIYTPSDFAKKHLMHLQEAGSLHALTSHASGRKGLSSYLCFQVSEGEGVLTYDGTPYPLHQGDCVLVDCRTPYAHRSDQTHLWTLRWAHFYGEAIRNLYTQYVERGGLPAFTPENPMDFENLLRDIYRTASAEDDLRDVRLHEKLTSLSCMCLAESKQISHTVNLKKNVVQEIREYLENHYAEEITLDQLADTFYINKYYLTRVYKEQFGVSIVSSLSQIRITHAKQLLRFTDLTTEEIGRTSGFEEAAYFSRVFKKVEGITPGEYRKLW